MLLTVESFKCMKILVICHYFSGSFYHIFQIDWLSLFYLSFFVELTILILNFSLIYLQKLLSFYIFWNTFDQDRNIWTKLPLTKIQFHMLYRLNRIPLHLLCQCYEKILNFYLMILVTFTIYFYWVIHEYLIYLILLYLRVLVILVLAQKLTLKSVFNFF